MKPNLLMATVCGASPMILSAGARASSVSLVPVLEVASQQTNAGLRDIYRVYAQFENPADRVHRWYGNAASPMIIQNVLNDGVTLGTGFTQFGGAGGQFAPKSPGTTRDWDTFATLGVLFGSEAPNGSDRTTLSPGFPVFITELLGR